MSTKTSLSRFTRLFATFFALILLLGVGYFNASACLGCSMMSGTKTVSGSFSESGTVIYTVTITNSGVISQEDNAGDEFSDVLPALLTLVSANATSGTAVASVVTNTVTWNGTLAPLGGSVTITITATINTGTAGLTISNQGIINYDADGNETNESGTLTDDPGTVPSPDPTSFTVEATSPNVTGTKTVSGTYAVGSTVTYTVSLNNIGEGTQGDNPGDEFTDILPSSLTLASATATSGTAVANVGTNTVMWNGSIPASASVTITITATIEAGTEGTTVSNQGTINYDYDGNGTNEETKLTDDPTVVGKSDPASFTVGAAPEPTPEVTPVVEIVVTAAPPPETPLCENHNFEENGVVRSSTSDAYGYAINCRVLYQNGAPTDWLGGSLYNAGSIGIPGVLDLGVQQAVDIFSPSGQNNFQGGAVFCLRGTGWLIWIAADGQPRYAEVIGSYTVPEFEGFTCATLFEPGTLVLVSEEPA
jgi:uncharacterized repeat protein (TIGR01451 family)